jgi:hypothetical protein
MSSKTSRPSSECAQAKAIEVPRCGGRASKFNRGDMNTRQALQHIEGLLSERAVARCGLSLPQVESLLIGIRAALAGAQS